MKTHVRTALLLPIFIVVFLDFFVQRVSAATYYVSSSSGNDTNTGLSTSTPWKTVAKVNAAALVAGDSVVFKKGDVWRERLTLMKSGTQGSPITYTSYGTGSNPVLDGSGTSLWVGLTDYYSSASLQWFVIDGLEIRFFQTGIHLEKSKNFIIRNSSIHDGGGGGNGLVSISNATDSEIDHNTIFNNSTQNGIWLSSGTQRIDVHHNKAYNCGTNGIGLSQTSYNIIRNNTVWNNSKVSPQYGGIGVEVNANYNQVFNNISYENTHAGLVLNGKNNDVFHNSLFNNTEYQLILTDWNGSAPINNTFKNNIFSVPTGSRVIAFFNSNSAGSWSDLSNTFDYNLYFLPSGDTNNFILGLSRNYSFAQWKSIAGKETKGLFSDPKVTSTTSHDFSLLSNSPAINAGVVTTVTTDSLGNSRTNGGAPDIGAYEFISSVSPTPTITPTSTNWCSSADINSDGLVDLLDYSILVRDFLKTVGGTSPVLNPRSDINGDGIVDLSDYSILVKNFLRSCSI